MLKIEKETRNPMNETSSVPAPASGAAEMVIPPCKPGYSPFYWFMKTWMTGFLRTYFRARVFHRERMPKSGPVLVVPTHASFLDPPVLGSLIGRECFFLSRENILKVPVIGQICRGVNTYPIRRGAGDREALKLCRNILTQGWPLVFYPEGTRTPDGKLGRLQPGFAMILDGMPEPIPYLPVMMQDTYKAMNRRQIFPRPCKVRIVVGEPAYLPARQEGERGRAYYDRCCAELEQRLRELGAA
jgi:1-acyl-sn-glycerol-3-phosphate acyltransferase